MNGIRSKRQRLRAWLDSNRAAWLAGGSLTALLLITAAGAFAVQGEDDAGAGVAYGLLAGWVVTVLLSAGLEVSRPIPGFRTTEREVSGSIHALLWSPGMALAFFFLIGTVLPDGLGTGGADPETLLRILLVPPTAGVFLAGWAVLRGRGTALEARGHKWVALAAGVVFFFRERLPAPLPSRAMWVVYAVLAGLPLVALPLWRVLRAHPSAGNIPPPVASRDSEETPTWTRASKP